MVPKVESSKDFFSAVVGDEIVVASSALDLFGLGDFCCKKIENQLLDFISLVQNRSYLYNRISIWNVLKFYKQFIFWSEWFGTNKVDTI